MRWGFVEWRKPKNPSRAPSGKNSIAKIRASQEFSARVAAQVHFNHCREMFGEILFSSRLLLIEIAVEHKTSQASWVSLTIIKHLHVRIQRDSLVCSLFTPSQSFYGPEFLWCATNIDSKTGKHLVASRDDFESRKSRWDEDEIQ